jgi:ankyrin repeat protein
MTTETELTTNTEIFDRIRKGDVAFVQGYFTDRRGQINLKNLRADVSNANEWDELTPLHCAAKYGHLEIVRLLVELGSEVYSHPLATYPAVMVAAWSKKQGVVDYFLKEIPDRAEGTRGLGATIHMAGRQGWFDLVRAHVELDPLAVHQRGWIGDSPLHWPAHNGYTEIVRYLLDHGAVANAHEIGWIGGTPLHWASERHPEIIRMLVAAGANPNAQVEKSGSDHLGGTPLHWCARQKDDCGDCITTLRELGTDPSIVDSFGKTALDWAVERSHTRCAAALA